MATNDFEPIPFGPMANCTLDLCKLEWSVFRYLPNVPANATFLAAFGLLMMTHVAQGFRYKAWVYMASMVAGCGLELAGYVGRIMLHHNPFDFNAFLVNLVPITVAPVFFCAAIYIQLTRVITHSNRSVSRFNPRFITFTFIPCDIISLVLQGTGGALSAGADTVDGTKLGVDVSKAGLIFQVITLVLFIGLTSDYLWALRTSHRKSGLRMERALKMMIMWLGAATILILVRCIFRIYELKAGYFAPAFRDEGTFIAFESVFMIIAVACLNVGCPGRAFRDPPTTSDTEIPLEALTEK
ncbi:parasitic phase-specific protein PSP-1 [Didymella exigua CBS 183.55]|uniref:Parasitic phase-specific protein PSP-1 n=1 Tax=Didymella exigua CBS 183.55 TaxID=1150837 RepID=A0A6A5RE50_9PLEO|nr:parasitic phase-specific protein PSP-1 [Didymella exigua CBS 183.55]KAF1925374.1 parasitic phase-specific protein PSP-1 [Didymella exigua CBS 183.55]